MNNFWILAQSEPGQGTAPAKITSDQPGQATESVTMEPAPNGAGPEDAVTNQRRGSPYSMLLIGGMLVLMYFVLFRGPRKKQQQQRQMIQSLRKNDRVRTIGGIIGTIVDVKQDEITLKIDESNNTKVKVIPSAISRNVSGPQT